MLHYTLLQCPCDQSQGGTCGDAGVRCKLVKSVSATNVVTPNYNTVLIRLSVKLQKNTITNLFQVECYSQ